MASTARSQRHSLYLVVVGAGLVTSALALFGVYWLGANSKTNVMGWYADFVIPVGAVIVGLVAASGYGVASWVSGVKITRSLLWTVLLLQLGAYFGAQYVEFRTLDLRYEDGQPVGFVEYFDAVSRSFAWEQKDGSAGEPLGKWGYAFRLLDILGFVGGGLVVPFVLRQKAYCSACQVYMRSRDLGLLPAGIVPRRVKKDDLPERLRLEEETRAAESKGQALLEAVARSATEGRASDLLSLLGSHAVHKKEYAKLTHRIVVSLASCPRCDSGLVGTAIWSGQGQKIERVAVGSHPVGPPFVRELSEGSRKVA